MLESVSKPEELLSWIHCRLRECFFDLRNHHRTRNGDTTCFVSHNWTLQLAVVVSIMPQPCYKLGLPFLALPLFYDTRRLPTIGEHLVTVSVTEAMSSSSSRCVSSLVLSSQLCELGMVAPSL